MRFIFYLSFWAARRHVVPRGKSKCGECASCAQPRLRLGCLNPTQSTPKKSELDSLECSLTSAQYRLPAERVVPLSVQKSKATGSQYTPKQHMPEEQKVLDPKHQSQVAHLQAELQQLKNQVAVINCFRSLLLLLTRSIRRCTQVRMPGDTAKKATRDQRGHRLLQLECR